MTENLNDNLYYELTELVLKMLSDNSSDVEAQRIRQILSDNPEAMDCYSDIILVYVGLSSSDGHIKYDSDEIPTSAELLREKIVSMEPEPELELPKVKSRPLPVRKPISISGILRFSGAIAAMIAVVILLTLAEDYSNAPKNYKALGNIASIVDTVDARWSNPEMQNINYPFNIKCGNYELQEGYAVIEFNNGTELVLEAPICLEILSNKEVNLELGRLVAKMDPGKKGFVVNTPGGKMIDLGTEFGVEVTNNKTSDLYVFDGKVSIAPKQNNISNAPAAIINAGYARRVRPDIDGIDEIQFNSARFVQKADYEVIQLASQGSSYHRWLEYQRKLRQDKDLLAYYAFLDDPSTDRLVNTAVATAGKLDGDLVHRDGKDGYLGTVVLPNDVRIPSWTAGRWDEKQALHFEHDKQQYVKVDWPADIKVGDNITFAAWIKQDSRNCFGHIISKRNYGPPQKMDFQWAVFVKDMVSYQTAMEFGFNNNDNIDNLFITEDIKVAEPLKWYHVALTYDINDGKAKMYVDGKLYGYLDYPYSQSNHSIASDVMYIGTDFFPDGDTDALQGCIDELVIMNRVLEPSEIKEMFLAGQPDDN
ncbi:MAG: FecR domain-containing protein [Phycisphaerae bacterium]|nr:FecR domain-containing protein [Phycisphaerae bacterium]